MEIIKTLGIGFSTFYCLMTFAQYRNAPVKLKYALPNILK